MQQDIVIAAGKLNTDIDILACATAYKELLELQNIKSTIVLPPNFNKSITSNMKGWIPEYNSDYIPSVKSQFVVVDISDPEAIAEFVDPDRIIELVDHHFGYEDYWKEKLGERAIIEKVGACGTLIWDIFKKNNLDSKISQNTAKLLIAAIVSNTLNFRAAVTSERDQNAFNELLPKSGLPGGWIEQYFSEQEIEIFENPVEAVKNDTHPFSTPGIKHTIIIGQLELWNSKKFIDEHKPEIKTALLSFNSEFWFLTSPSISEGKNYIYCEDKEIKEILSKALNIEFKNDLATTNKLILRKEIKKLLMDL